MIRQTDIIYILPPAGLIVPCYKPKITARTPAQLPEDVLKLKLALKECSQYVDDYLNWRNNKEISE